MKKRNTIYLMIALIAFSFSFCKKDSDSEDVYGCTDPVSTNYNPAATVDNGSCQYLKHGCMDPISINYDSTAEVDDGSCLYAGTGGNLNIIASPEHHGVPIPGFPGNLDTAFIKYNAISSPGASASDYDTLITGQVGDNFVLIPGVKPGRYYIFMAGYDTSISMPVRGGVPFVFTLTSGNYDIVVPVSE